MQSSGLSGGVLWLVINFVAIIFLGAALVYGVTQWRSRRAVGKAVGDRASEKLSKVAEADQPEENINSLETQRYAIPALVILGFAFALGMLWWGIQATQTDLAQNPPTTSGQSSKKP
jgi:TRAP-type C4-dicarboxylate transport system permease small subunit